MELNICHLYPDLLNIYGDIGNILILKNRAERRNIKINIVNISTNDEFEKDKYDIVFLGGGQGYEQLIASDDIIKNKKYDISNYIESNKVFLSVCGGYQLLGNYYTTEKGKKIEGLGILDIYTENGNNKFIGNSVIYNEHLNETYVGFENHIGKTYIGKLDPLGKVMVGYGNNGEDNTEGCIYKNTYCTYLHGPLLSKNPELADRLILLALQTKYGDIKLEPLDDWLELKAKKFIINREQNKK